MAQTFTAMTSTDSLYNFLNMLLKYDCQLLRLRSICDINNPEVNYSPTWISRGVCV